MAISFVAAGAVALVVSSNLNIAVPAGFAKNDLLIATVTTGTVAVTTPVGWELLSAYTGALPYLYVFYKYATVSEATLVVPTTSVVAKGVMVAYRGGGGFQIVPVTANATSATATPNTLTTTYANAYSINFYSTASGTTRTLTPNASTTSRVNSGPTAAVNGLLVADELRVTTGTGPARSATISGGSVAWSCVTIGLIEDRTLYWVGGNGTWSTPGAGTTGANWSNTSGGAGGVIVPTQNDAVIVNGSSGSPVITLSGSPACLSLTTTGATCTLSLLGIQLNGSMTLSATTTWSAFGPTCTGTGTITTNGVTIGGSITFNGASQTFTLGDNLTTTAGSELTSGTLVLNGFNLTVGTSFNFNNSNTRSISFGSNYIDNNRTTTGTVIDATTLTGFTFTGTGGFRLTGAAASGVTRSVGIASLAGGSAANAPNVLVTAGAVGSTVSIPNNSWVGDLDFTGFSGTFAPPASLNIAGSLTAVSNMTWTTGTGVITFAATSTGKTVTTAGKTLANTLFDGVGGGWALQDDLTINSTRALSLNSGTFNANNQNVTTGTFSSTNSIARTLTMGSGTWTLSGTGTVWNVNIITNLTFNANTANIVLSDTSTTARTFQSVALAYNKLTIGGSTGTSTLTLAGTSGFSFTEIASTKTVAHTITLSVNISVANWTATGTAGNVLTLNSSAAGTQRTLALTGGGTVSGIDYLSIQDINFTPTPSATQRYVWYVGTNSTFSTNVTGGALRTSDTTQIAYNLTSGTSWTVPSNWNSSNNNVYLVAGGGGGSGSVVPGATANHLSGSGGGGGGFTSATNISLTPSASVAYAIGAAGSAGTGSTTVSTAGAGGATTFNTGTYTTTGGGGAITNNTGSIITGGAAGTGATFNGGAGGVGNGITNASRAGGGGGGSGGINGAGVAGGASATTTPGTGGAGNANNASRYISIGTIAYGNGATGGAVGAAGGTGTIYGGGGSGGGCTSSSATTFAGGVGSQGAIFILYTVTPPASGNFLNFFYQ